MEYKEYYKALGVEPKATDEEVKRAYRRLARKYHPDVNPGDATATERFKEINEAYQVLGDPEKRAKYDQFGADVSKLGSFEEAVRRAASGRAAGPIPGVEFGAAGLGGFSEFFEAVFGKGSQAQTRAAGARTQRSTDIEHDIDITLDEVLSGGTRVLNLRVPELDGKYRNRRLEVRIPKGVRDGSRIRVAGEGAYKSEGLRGDLFLKVRVVGQEGFERRGNDVVTDVSVPLSEALLGAPTSVANLDGARLSVKIPPETRDGSMLRLRGQGLPSLNGTARGDLLVRVHVKLPENLTTKEKRLIYEFGAGRNERPSKPD